MADGKDPEVWVLRLVWASLHRLTMNPWGPGNYLLNLFLICKEDKILSKEDVSIFPDPDEQQPDSSRYWVEIMHRQELLHNQELASWRAAVETAAKLLKQTEHSFLRLAQVMHIWNKEHFFTFHVVSQGFNQENNRRLLKLLLNKMDEDTFGKLDREDDL